MTSSPFAGAPCPAAPASDLAELLEMARHQLLDSAAGLQERREPGRHPRFAYSKDGGAVAMRLVEDPPNLFLHFTDGAALPDPAGLLRGGGRRGRYVCLGAVRVEDQPPLRILIAAATASQPFATETDIDHQPSATA